MNRSRPVTGDGRPGRPGDQPDIDRERRGRHAAPDGRTGNQKDDLPTDPALIVAEIARTRRELGETLEALSARMDLRTRARESVALAQNRVTEWAGPAAWSYRPLIGAVAGAGVAALLAGMMLVLRRRGRRRR